MCSFLDTFVQMQDLDTKYRVLELYLIQVASSAEHVEDTP